MIREVDRKLNGVNNFEVCTLTQTFIEKKNRKNTTRTDVTNARHTYFSMQTNVMNI